VAADDPRIIASGVIDCRDALGLGANLAALVDVPAIPRTTPGTDVYAASR